MGRLSHMMTSIIKTGLGTNVVMNVRAHPTQGKPGENERKITSNSLRAAEFQLFHGRSHTEVCRLSTTISNLNLDEFLTCLTPCKKPLLITTVDVLKWHFLELKHLSMLDSLSSPEN